jgi:hypothetical protein
LQDKQATALTRIKLPIICQAERMEVRTKKNYLENKKIRNVSSNFIRNLIWEEKVCVQNYSRFSRC